MFRRGRFALFLATFVAAGTGRAGELPAPTLAPPSIEAANPANDGVGGSSVNPAPQPDDDFRSLNQAFRGAQRNDHRDFAAAMANYRQSADFACRQPIYAEYFRRRFGDGPVEAPCDPRIPFWILDHRRGGNFAAIDSRRVRSIHLLFAGKASSLASRFGHVALRVIVCPTETSTDDECNENVGQHLVLGFLAQVDELSLSYLQGLFGGYRSYLFAMPFIQVLEEYTRLEFRELHSLPLRMSDQQRSEALRRLADVHWRFVGNYRFFSDNCATQLQDVFPLVWRDFPGLEGTWGSFIRPDLFFEDALSRPWTEGEKLRRPDEAERDGYFFPATDAYYRIALQFARTDPNHPAFSTLDNYLAIPPLMRRTLWLPGDQSQPAKPPGEPAIEAFIVLEELAATRTLRNLIAQMSIQLIGDGHALALPSEKGSDQEKLVERCFLRPIKDRASPKSNPDGIPDLLLAQEEAAAETGCETPQAKKDLRAALLAILKADAAQWQSIENIIRSLDDTYGNLESLEALLALEQLSNQTALRQPMAQPQPSASVDFAGGGLATK